jgi:Ca2+/H+ antiporter, TMEM165/GDT1 family
MRHSRLTVFLGAISALALMTVLSACLGWFAQLIPFWFTFYASTTLFAIFGLKMIYEAWHMSSAESKEVSLELAYDSLINILKFIRYKKKLKQRYKEKN